LSSSALGSNEWYYIPSIGRVHMDVMKIIQKDYKLESYKLDNVAFHFIGQRKDDITPK
jgi:DNA polymerase elongation subunit (family B)